MHEKVKKVLEKNKKMIVSSGISSIEVIEISQDGIVSLKYTGPCGHDSLGSVVTLSVIEGKIKQEVPGIIAVKSAWYWPGK